MVSGFICGTSSLPREEDEYDRQTRSADSSPSRSRCKSSSNKNPYSSRGLDKFSALLAEIEEKRQQIYSQVDPDEISLVRFAYSGDHDFKPIVVKAKAKNSPDVVNQPKSDTDIKASHMKKLQSSKSMNVKQETKAENEVKMTNKKMGFSKTPRVCHWKEPKLILPMIFIFILVFLVLFGKSFAIMCTSIGWYVIPTITNTSNSSSNSKFSFKKDYAIRKLSHKKLMTSEGTKSFKTDDRT